MKKLFILFLMLPLLTLADDAFPPGRVAASNEDKNAPAAHYTDVNAGAVIVKDGASPQKVCELCILSKKIRRDNKNTNAGPESTLHGEPLDSSDGAVDN